MGRGLWTVNSYRGGQLTEFEEKLYEEFVRVEIHNTYNRKTTVLILKLKSGFEIVGTAGCEDPSKFDEELGHLYALKDALQKLGEFAAFYRAQMAQMALMDKENKELDDTKALTRDDVAIMISERLKEHLKYRH